MDYNSIYIDGEIVSETDAGSTYPYTTLGYVRDALSWVDITALGNDGLTVYINSPGGSYTEGMGIYDLLMGTGLKITTVAVGQCSSMASLIFMAGTTRRAMPNATFHPHCPWGGITGDATATAAYAADLLAKETTMTGIYAARSAKSTDEVLAMLKLDKDMTAAEALAFGLVTEVATPVSAVVYADKKPGTRTPAAGSTTSGSLNPATRPGVSRRTRMAGTAKTPGEKSETQRRGILAGLGRFARDIKALLDGEEVKALTVKTTGDTPLELNISTDDSGKIQAGDPIVTSAGDPVADGSYTLEDGTVITVVGGFVDTVKMPETTDTEAEAAAAAASAAAASTTTTPAADDFKAKYEAEVLKNTGLETRLAATSKRVEQIAAMVVTGGLPPVVDAIENGGHNSQQRQQPAAGKVADANSDEAKQAAKASIQRRKEAKAKKPAGR